MAYYEQDRATLLAELHSDAESGLSSATIAERQQTYGANQFEEQKGESIGSKILHNLRDMATIVLLVAATLSLFLGIYKNEGYTEFIVIMGIVILNMILAITQERSAEKSLAALRSLNSPTSLILRDGTQQEVDSAQLVPGDILLLKAGDMVSADARLLFSVDLTVDESALTGESLPSEKDAEAELSGKVPIADQSNMVFSGCLVTAGRAKALVVATGMKTQMGLIAGYLNNTQKLRTPLQNRIDIIGKTISLIAVVSALAMFAVGFIRGAELWDMIFVAISLAVAAVPETLQLIVTLSLSHGVTEMVKKHALIRKLPAVETLGSTSVICTDKTGTLTQNRMTVERLWFEGGEPFDAGSEFNPEQMALLNKAELTIHVVAEAQPDGNLNIIGAPTEIAIMRLFLEKGGNQAELEGRYPKVAEIAFSSERKMSTTIHRDPAGGYLVLTLGAYDRVPFEVMDAHRMAMREHIHDDFAHDAYRMVALGSKRIDELPGGDDLASVEENLIFEGIFGIIDPPRMECARAIATAKNAGIRTVMITGDHAATAGAIGRQLGILSEGEKILTGLELAEMSDEELIENVAQYSIYARVSPEDKIRIVEAWQEHDEVVVMTGDGVNDAPALKAADVGVAMGIAGTEVAKSAADMVLTDDNYSTIVEAVYRGRNVFYNIRKTIYFLLVCNISEIVIMLGAQFLGWGIPLTPIMLLLINIIGDGIPGMALAREKSDMGIMQRHPIGRSESLFAGQQLLIAQQTIAFVAAGWIAYYIGTFVDIAASCPPSPLLGQTLCFIVVGWTSILHIFNVRSGKQPIFQRGFRDNPMLTVNAVAMLVLFALFLLLPPFQYIFKLAQMGWAHWLIAIGLSLIPLSLSEISKRLRNWSEENEHRHRLIRHRLLRD